MHAYLGSIGQLIHLFIGQKLGHDRTIDNVLCINENWNIATHLNDEGLRTICLSQNARAVSQLVRGALLTSQDDIPYAPNAGMPWLLFIGRDDPQLQLLGTFINALVSSINPPERHGRPGYTTIGEY